MGRDRWIEQPRRQTWWRRIGKEWDTSFTVVSTTHVSFSAYLTSYPASVPQVYTVHLAVQGTRHIRGGSTLLYIVCVCVWQCVPWLVVAFTWLFSRQELALCCRPASNGSGLLMCVLLSFCRRSCYWTLVG